MKRVTILFVLLIIISLSVSAHATLYDRGGGLIYDSALNITWLQDADYIRTTGYLPNGDDELSWRAAKQWADNLSYYDSVRNVYWNDWRLPKTLPVNPPAYDLRWGYKGMTDRGFNITSPNSEFSYLYYVTLGNLGGMSTEGVQPQPGWGLRNTGPFLNIIISYWSQSEFIPDTEVAYFNMLNGEQLSENIDVAAHEVWAVRDGDVTSVAEPTTLLLLGFGLIGLAGVRRKIKK